MKQHESDLESPSVEYKEIQDEKSMTEKLQHLTSKLLVEQRGIERVLPEDRTDSSLWHIVAVWWSANIGISTMSVGILGPDSRIQTQSPLDICTANIQGFWESTVLIIIFNLLSLAPVAFFATHSLWILLDC
ncbi:Purine-cytosine permease fcyB [Neolecta irregularis DAH-3]|uniref:Purine-cytosine permease fcyB n=1 Tax=Neolecta irregularis (strain DAH-3) TaxID=1198029 RepID=A0A1U7LLI2_NEOID|nr:Purine-cytosine permease fcyB [Neolecta irregularis DAH-3]|eukprot:OLL23526.1 Purine-cytosine permease fcyB [Neolecta irregularis DAH-3]